MEIIIKWSMCRTCKSEETTNLQSLFNSDAPKYLNEYAGLNVVLDDGLPDKICAACIHMLEKVHKFVTTCKQADEQLKSLVRQAMSSSVFKIPTSTEAVVEKRRRARKQMILERQEEDHKIDYSGDSILTDESSLDDEIETLVELSQDSPTVQDSPAAISHMNESSEKNAAYLTSTDSIEYQINDQANGDVALCINVGSYEDYLAENDDAQDNSAIKPEPSTEYEIDLAVACVPERHRCIVCSNTYNSSSKLADHMRTHLNERSYECEVCFKRFSASCNLNTHIRTHTGEKPYKCEHCLRCFADRSTQRKHERMHTNERPYACHICEKTFALSSTRKAHILTHSKEKAHACLKCNKKFRLPHQLKAHLNTYAHMMMEIEDRDPSS
ncbi:zinc finger protein 20 [Drosophila miranda]|uniref:zinc finger protein 20 n=1 Tax=Drosophila miranda TaxID=7229 RepID=UPI0007E89722|nr:zinc finger protein 20 [Drosophila miranda]